ncbi:hypothetical protein [Mesorhizobium sp. M0909]|uniref:hypothetical protein n=1 Tax=Mesorhizobium sp. M0909 TaxID=2957024 RepID=UPI003338CF96
MLLMVRMPDVMGGRARIAPGKRSAIPKLHLVHIASASLHRSTFSVVEKSQEVALTRLVPQPSLSLIQTLGGA